MFDLQQDSDSTRTFQRATQEVELVLIQFGNPQEELFDRYLSKNTEEKEALVLALIAKAVLGQRRMNHVSV